MQILNQEEEFRKYQSNLTAINSKLITTTQELDNYKNVIKNLVNALASRPGTERSSSKRYSASGNEAEIRK